MLPLILILPPIFFLICGALCALHSLESASLGFAVLGMANVWALARVLAPVLEPKPLKIRRR